MRRLRKLSARYRDRLLISSDKRFLEFVGIARECDHLHTTPDELGILDGISAKSTDTKDTEYSIEPEGLISW